MLPDNRPRSTSLHAARRPIRQEAGGIEISPAINANAEPVDQFATEPTGHQRREQANHLERKREIRTIPGLVNHRKPGRRSRC